jgi:hypothetical protein
LALSQNPAAGTNPATPASTSGPASRGFRPDRSSPGASSGQNGTLDGGRHELPHSISFTIAYDLWLRGWDAALSAIAIAAQSGTLSTTEAGAHRAAIAVERELVTQHFAHLLRMTEELPGLLARGSVDTVLRRRRKSGAIGGR